MRAEADSTDAGSGVIRMREVSSAYFDVFRMTDKQGRPLREAVESASARIKDDHQLRERNGQPQTDTHVASTSGTRSTNSKRRSKSSPSVCSRRESVRKAGELSATLPRLIRYTRSMCFA